MNRGQPGISVGDGGGFGGGLCSHFKEKITSSDALVALQAK